MSHTYSSNRVHVIFSTKNRKKSLSKELQSKLWPYMAGISHNHGFEAIKIGGAVDHVHALLLLPPTLPLAKAVQLLKGSSSHWLPQSEQGLLVAGGLRRVQCGRVQTDDVVKYILNQAEHHAKRSFEEEFLEFPQEIRVAYDPAHVMG
jgi:REP element-mobilizing transposase RayT